ncbi:unnamed protein product [Malus baccata var. baccata]
MKHLRYLDLRHNLIKRLPDWIVELSNLETLDLSGCENLVEMPRDIKKMINLRHLNLKDCCELARIPRGLGELIGLRTLGTFALRENNSFWRDSASLGDLGRLNELRGELDIRNLRHRKDVLSESNGGALLKEKQHLRSLGLFWKRGENVGAVEEKVMSMEVLQPHSNLEEFSMWYYCGVRFASWFSSLINIVNLKLSFCERCQHLPPLDHLPSLKFLQLSNLEKLEYISDSESSSSTSDEMMRMSFFPSLEELCVVNCPVLKGWWRANTHNCASSSSTANLSFPVPSFPCLSRLTIRHCPNLNSMPLYPNVDRIHLYRTSSKVLPSLFVRGAYDITHDVGVDVSASTSSPHLSKLTHLSLNGIEDLECITSQGMGYLTSLRSVSIENCPNLASLPEEINNLMSLQHLVIRDCYYLASLPEGIRRLPCLNRFEIWRCPMLYERCQKEKDDIESKISSSLLLSHCATLVPQQSDYEGEITVMAHGRPWPSADIEVCNNNKNTSPSSFVNRDSGDQSLSSRSIRTKDGYLTGLRCEGLIEVGTIMSLAALTQPKIAELGRQPFGFNM